MAMIPVLDNSLETTSIIVATGYMKWCSRTASIILADKPDLCRKQQQSQSEF
jgi:hypothetical protein